MPQGNEVVSYKSLTLELPTLSFDLIAEILCRLPVKLLVQLRCVCKFFNSLISNTKFAKKHFQFSTKRHHLILTNQLVLHDSPIPSVFSTSTVFTQTQLYPPDSITIPLNFVYKLCSCDGIFCGILKAGSSYFLWNPSITKFKLLPPLKSDKWWTSISFGYDHFIDNYKVIVDVSFKNEVFVHTLGTDYWTRIDDIPYHYRIYGKGVFLSGAVNWLARDGSNNSLYFILSLDLKNESYHELYLPADFKNIPRKLDVVRDCLCVFETSDMFLNVWIMKEYGKKESWTKLYTIPNLQDRGLYAFTALYISEDDQLLVECCELDDDNGYIKLVVYDSKTGTLNMPEFPNNYEHTDAIVYIESLISP